MSKLPTIEQVLCEVYDCNEDNLQIEITLHPAISMLKKAFKIYSENVIDKCAESAELDLSPSADSYGVSIDKDSILNVKTLVR